MVWVWRWGFVEDVVHVAEANDGYDCYAGGDVKLVKSLRGGWKNTYAKPSIKMPITAIFCAVLIFNPKNIQNGSARTSTSVNIVRHDIEMWKLFCTHVAVFFTSISQFAEIGRHCRTATRKIAMAWSALNVKIPQMA